MLIFITVFFCRFEKVWHIRNPGVEAWPAGCYVQCSDGNNLGGERVELPALQPGHSTNVAIKMMSPPAPGIYQSKWRACTPAGSYFGGKRYRG